MWLIEYLTRPSYYTNQVSRLHVANERLAGFPRRSFSIPKLGCLTERLQDRMAKILSDADLELSLAKKRQSALSHQKRGLMHKLLTGEWRAN